MKIEFSMKGRRGKNVIVSLKAEAFNHLIKRGKVNIKWSRFNLREFLRPLQCFNCYKYGHLAKYCKQKRKCRNCYSETHDTEHCEEDTHCENCKLQNERYNTSRDTHHSMRDRNCFVFENELIKLRSRIDYGRSN